MGDLGNVIQGNNGMVDTVISDAMVSIEGEYSVIGKAMVVSHVRYSCLAITCKCNAFV